MNIRETDLPGIGRKFHISARSGDQMIVIVHDDGRRECYHFEEGNLDEARSMITLDDDEARMAAAIIGGMTYKPTAVETMEMALDDLIIEWYRVQSDDQAVGRTIGELNVRQNSGATIIAVIQKNHMKYVNPGPDIVLLAESMLVVAGERSQQKLFKNLIKNGGE
ncbi:cation:proton antiporter regulatory subunit [Paenibacillus nasutitermitis]|uniref:Potassium transporter n=1 Tax=Paenibacillus nasutitermitis TaxID=1652958 RepID=A0A916Z5M4_9BACL|nr:cation:proton antiporter regulatory subunit [Paenibacillus nasutitermitis]GGD75047.1 potassium transporter [Paenibacillus nasutitermitis]